MRHATDFTGPVILMLGGEGEVSVEVPSAPLSATIHLTGVVSDGVHELVRSRISGRSADLLRVTGGSATYVPVLVYRMRQAFDSIAPRFGYRLIQFVKGDYRINCDVVRLGDNFASARSDIALAFVRELIELVGPSREIVLTSWSNVSVRKDANDDALPSLSSGVVRRFEIGESIVHVIARPGQTEDEACAAILRAVLASLE